MKRLFLVALLSVYISGCFITDFGYDLLSNASGFNLNACKPDPDVCTQLFFDNIDKVNLLPPAV